MIPSTLKIFSKRDVNFLNQLLNVECNAKSCDQLKRKFRLNNSWFFKWLQLKQYQVIVKKTLKNYPDTIDNLIYRNHYLIKKNRLLNLEKLNSKEQYNIIILPMENKIHIKNIFSLCFQTII